MSTDPSPWRQQPPPKRPASGSRFVVWLFLLVILGAGVWGLSEAFPGTISSNEDRAYLLQSIAILAFVIAGVVFARQMGAREVMRNIAIWTAIAAVLVVAFIYRNEFSDFGTRLRAEFISGEPVVTGPKELVLSRNADGHFYAFGEANGTRVRFLVDTGASDTVLSPSDATRIGIDAKELRFTRPYGTANGVSLGAPYRLSLFSIGPIEVADMAVSVNQADMGSSLLGMSFLNRLASFEIRGDRLFLRWR